MKRGRSRAAREANALLRAYERKIAVLENHIEVRDDLRSFEPPKRRKIPRRKGGKSSVIPILFQSDEHYDSEFGLAQTGGINEQSPDMAETKVETLIRRVRRLVEREALDNHIPGIVSPLMGDMIELGDTDTLFTNPRMKQTEDYITGRFG